MGYRPWDYKESDTTEVTDTDTDRNLHERMGPELERHLLNEWRAGSVTQADSFHQAGGLDLAGRPFSSPSSRSDHGVPPGAPAQVPADPRCGLSSLFTVHRFAIWLCGAVDPCADPREQLLRFHFPGLPPWLLPGAHIPALKLGKSTPGHRASLLFRPQEDRSTPSPCKQSGHLGHFDPTGSLL